MLKIDRQSQRLALGLKASYFEGDGNPAGPVEDSEDGVDDKAPGDLDEMAELAEVDVSSENDDGLLGDLLASEGVQGVQFPEAGWGTCMSSADSCRAQQAAGGGILQAASLVHFAGSWLVFTDYDVGLIEGLPFVAYAHWPMAAATR